MGNTMSDSKREQIEDMWAEYDYFANDWEYDFYRKAHRCEPLPTPVSNYLRNDPVADYEDELARERGEFVEPVRLMSAIERIAERLGS